MSYFMPKKRWALTESSVYLKNEEFQDIGESAYPSLLNPLCLSLWADRILGHC